MTSSSNFHTVNVMHNKIPQEIIDQFRFHDVAKISDAMGKYGSLHQAIKPIRTGLKICGQAVTISCEPGDFLAVKRACSFAKNGDVIVVAGSGFLDFAIVDGDVCSILQHIGAEGLVVDGATSQKTQIIGMNFPVFTRGTSLRKISIENGNYSINKSISCGGLLIEPGDLIVADDDGVVAIPHHDVDRVLNLTDAKLKKELSNQEKIDKGAIMTELYGCDEKINKWRT